MRKAWLLIAIGALALVIGGLVVYDQLAGSASIGNGPGMIYFYADW